MDNVSLLSRRPFFYARVKSLTWLLISCNGWKNKAKPIFIPEANISGLADWI